jgi:hypothetical protein
MKTRVLIIAIASLIVLVCSISNAQETSGKGARGRKTTNSETKNTYDETKVSFSLAFNASLTNSYTRGNLDTWFGERTNDPTRLVDQGSPAFFLLEAELIWSNSNAILSYGAGLGFVIPPSHSLWGTEVIFGGGHELVLNPVIISIYMPIKCSIGESKDLFLTFDPALLMGWVTGTYTGSTTMNFSPSPGFGFGAAVGLQYFLSSFIEFSLKGGFRLLKTNLAYASSLSTTGYKQPNTDSGDPVKADLSGVYVVYGIGFCF